MHRYKQGESWWITDTKLIELAKFEQLQRTVRDPWIDVIAEWVARHDPIIVTPHQIGYAALNITYSQLDHLASQRIGHAMKSLGFISKAAWNSQTKQPGRVWVRPDYEMLKGI